MNELIWHWPIVIYLFLGGLSGGLFTAVAGLESYGQIKQFHRTIKWGSILSWVLIAFGIIILVMELQRPERGIYLLLFPRFSSPMSYGTLVIVGFMLLGLTYWVTHTGFLINKIHPPIHDFLKKYRVIIATVGGTFGIMTGIYTGILLMYSRYALWNTILLPILFLASALSTGYALFLLLAKATNEANQTKIRDNLPKLVVVLGIIELFVVYVYLAYLPSYVRTALLSFDNTYGILFLIIFLVGGIIFGEIVLPLLELITRNEFVAYIAAFLTLLGGFTLRYVIVFLGPLFY